VTPLPPHYYPCLYKTRSGILVDYMIAQSLYDEKNVMTFFCYENTLKNAMTFFVYELKKYHISKYWQKEY
jgi:hypothetical protein